MLGARWRGLPGALTPCPRSPLGSGGLFLCRRRVAAELPPCDDYIYSPYQGRGQGVGSLADYAMQRVRRMKRPAPMRPTNSRRSTITSPRSSTVSGRPRTARPSFTV